MGGKETENNTTEEIENEEGTVDSQGNKNTPKAFTQTEVDEIVKNRLNREKALTKKEKEDFQTRETEYKEIIEKYEGILKGLVESKKADLPDNYKNLVNKLSIIEQFEFLNDEKNQLSKKEIPSTPKPSNETIPQKNKILNKFKI